MNSIFTIENNSIINSTYHNRSFFRNYDGSRLVINKSTVEYVGWTGTTTSAGIWINGSANIRDSNISWNYVPIVLAGGANYANITNNNISGGVSESPRLISVQKRVYQTIKMVYKKKKIRGTEPRQEGLRRIKLPWMRPL